MTLLVYPACPPDLRPELRPPPDDERPDRLAEERAGPIEPSGDNPLYSVLEHAVLSRLHYADRRQERMTLGELVAAMDGFTVSQVQQAVAALLEDRVIDIFIADGRVTVISLPWEVT